MLQLKNHLRIALFYFFLVALFGLVLRLFFVAPLPGEFRFLVHTHSHIALLGWVYLGLSSLIYKMYFQKAAKEKSYKRIFWFTNVCILGMLCSFPFTGYALFSIIFSTLFLIASYFLAGFVIKNIPEKYKNTFSFKIIKAALWYLVISSIGPWAIGGVMATLGSGSIWYKLSIYFYLHFQYNAWFILALLGCFFYILEKKEVQLDGEKFKSFFRHLNFGLVLSVFLSALWVKPPVVFYFLGGLGAILQIIAFYKLYLMLKKPITSLKLTFSPPAFLLLKLTATLFILKLIMQLFSALPYFAELAYRFQDFVIGYLHLVFLGIVSTALCAFLEYFKLIRFPKFFLPLYLFAFIFSELLIFYKGTSMWLGLPFSSEYFTVLTGVSLFFPITVGLLFFTNLKLSNSSGIKT